MCYGRKSRQVWRRSKPVNFRSMLGSLIASYWEGGKAISPISSRGPSFELSKRSPCARCCRRVRHEHPVRSGKFPLHVEEIAEVFATLLDGNQIEPADDSAMIARSWSRRCWRQGWRCSRWQQQVFSLRSGTRRFCLWARRCPIPRG